MMKKESQEDDLIDLITTRLPTSDSHLKISILAATVSSIKI